ncbi:Nif3-like dinuclear metal center hexameric protein [Ignavigranum ruoffiae]|uniref:Nif3-like dinuclear metal center hexameric protein n=1 Tax=Ignavigranum ruoffiae TaxID=89093 RepID=UPI003B0052B2
MNSDNLSLRLLKVAEYIEKYGQNPIRLADIGTDHAYLPVYLIKQSIIESAIAGEVVRGPFESAQAEVRRQHLTDRIQVRLGDGLSVLDPEDLVNVVSICGMGGKLISQILDQAPQVLTDQHTLVLQSNNGSQWIRSWLSQHNYQIVDEEIINEHKHDYQIIVAQKIDKDRKEELSAADLLMGPINRQKKHPQFIAKWTKELEQRRRILKQILQAKQAQPQLIEPLRQSIQMIQEELSMTEAQHTPQLKDITDFLDYKYPQSLAESWDQVGLHFGRSSQPVQRLMTALDLRPQIVQEAIERKVDTLIVHHPPIFQSIQRFNLDFPNIEMYSQIIKHNISVYALHTNLDIAWDGMNDWLAEALSLSDIQSLASTSDTDQPGLGRVGTLDQPLSRIDLLNLVKERFALNQLTVIEAEPKSSYQKIVIIGGSGSSLLEQVAATQADVFITGDITYHKGHQAQDFDFMTLDCGHYIESIFNHKMAEILREASQHFAWSIEVLESSVSTSPFEYY